MSSCSTLNTVTRLADGVKAVAQLTDDAKSVAQLADDTQSTKVNIDSLPGVKDLKLKQEELVKKHSSATIMLLQSQQLALEALDLRQEAAEVEAQINNLKSNPNDGSLLTSTLESLSGRQEMINEKVAELENREKLKLDTWKKSCSKLNEALWEEAKLAATNTDLGVKLTKAMGGASSLEKVQLGLQFRPIVYFVTSLPKDYKLMQQTSALQDEVNKKLVIQLPPMKAIPASLPEMKFDF